MSIRELSNQAIDQLIGTRHETTGIEFPPAGLQPYHAWLIRTLQLLSESSLGAFRVYADDASPTSVGITPGRAIIAETRIDLPRSTLELATHNNQTVFVWLSLVGTTPTINVRESSLGWPETAHLKLAQITISTGLITDILDLRCENIFRV